MEWNEKTAAALTAAMDSGVLCEDIAEAADAAAIRSLLAAEGVELSDRAAGSAFAALTRLRADGLTEEDLRFLSGGCAALGEDGVGAWISILAMVRYRRCMM